MKNQTEIERKFLITDGWREQTDGTRMVLEQVYVVNTPEIAIRIGTRILYAGDVIRRASITIKIPREGLVRSETELDLEWELGSYLVTVLRDKFPSVQKVRHFVPTGGSLYWEIDCFTSRGLQQLTMAEIEIPFDDYEFEKPDWIGREVTNDPFYYNAHLAQRREVPTEKMCTNTSKTPDILP